VPQLSQKAKNKLAYSTALSYLPHMREPFEFQYVLKFPNGKYYTGRVNSPELPDYWQGEKHEAYTMTEYGAYTKKDSLSCFAECTVEKVV
jgi:hypothetical protein